MKLTDIFLMLLTEASKIEFIVDQRGPAVVKAAKNDRGQRASGVDYDSAASIVQYISDEVGDKYLVWCIGQYIKGNFKLEDLTRIRSTLEKFERVRSKLPHKDIGQYKTLRDLYQAMSEVNEEDAISRKQQEKITKLEGAEYVINTPDFKVIIPKTEAAACLYGKGTEWCTAATESNNMFNHYNEQGPLYIIIAGNRKFQLHYESDQFMDEHDSEVGEDDVAYLSKYPEYADFLNMLIKKHYSKYFDDADKAA